MGTHAILTFRDGSKELNVFKHSDGYPFEVAKQLDRTIKHYAFSLPRFEADAFAASYVAANTHYWVNQLVNKVLADEPIDASFFRDRMSEYLGGGETRIINLTDLHRYPFKWWYITFVRDGSLFIRARHVDDSSDSPEFYGTFDQFKVWAESRRG